MEGCEDLVWYVAVMGGRLVVVVWGLWCQHRHEIECFGDGAVLEEIWRAIWCSFRD